MSSLSKTTQLESLRKLILDIGNGPCYRISAKGPLKEKR
jgi:hypothetical protein